MSRTYRKNSRHYIKYRGVIYNTYDDKTVKGKACRFATLNKSRKSYYRSEVFDGGRYYCEVLVGDSENYSAYGRSIKWYKRIAHKRDRARCRQALYHHPEDVHFKPGFDRWEID